ncbi:hypothetical protein AGLY_017344 [Aphis glycines]|uniref:Uncharacterized protein n=1 Tax=Aphis glycines TaxID=307491 RepID=A0A6G0SVY6_APHGL|nr:hypothetical protein AGLY_017344 [Aphis glycines]
MNDLSDISDPDELSTISPKRLNPKGKYIYSRQKIMVINLYKDILMKSPDIKYEDLVTNLSKALGLGRETISKTIAEYRRTNTVSSPNKKRVKSSLFDKIDDLDRNGLRQKIHSFWLRRELPTIDKILIAVNEDPSLPNFKRSTLYSTIKKLHFVFEKRKRCSVLTEREDYIF